MFFRCHFFMGLNCQAISYQISFLCLEKKSYNNKSPLEMVLCNTIHQRPINSSRPQSSIENLLFAVAVKQIKFCRRFTSQDAKPFWEIKKGFGKSTFDNQCMQVILLSIKVWQIVISSVISDRGGALSLVKWSLIIIDNGSSNEKNDFLWFQGVQSQLICQDSWREKKKQHF